MHKYTNIFFELQTILNKNKPLQTSTSLIIFNYQSINYH
jgi:hypothetical protein